MKFLNKNLVADRRFNLFAGEFTHKFKRNIYCVIHM